MKYFFAKLFSIASMDWEGKKKKNGRAFFYCSVCWGKWNQVVENVGDNVRLYTVVNWAKHCHWHHKSTWKGNQERERDRQWGKNRFWVRESKQDVETFVSMSAKTRRHYTKTSSKVFTPPLSPPPLKRGPMVETDTRMTLTSPHIDKWQMKFSPHTNTHSHRTLFCSIQNLLTPSLNPLFLLV